MPDATTQIRNLLFRYAELIDRGQLTECAALFDRGAVYVAGQALQGAAIEAMWRRFIILYPCGTPRTRHLIHNEIIEFEQPQKATVRSCFTVYQATDNFPLQLILTGRYHDSFECENDEWYFISRVYAGIDLRGDTSHHIPSASF